jgi:hypothetical protein
MENLGRSLRSPITPSRFFIILWLYSFIAFYGVRGCAIWPASHKGIPKKRMRFRSIIPSIGKIRYSKLYTIKYNKKKNTVNLVSNDDDRCI